MYDLNVAFTWNIVAKDVKGLKESPWRQKQTLIDPERAAHVRRTLTAPQPGWPPTLPHLLLAENIRYRLWLSVAILWSSTG